MAEVADPRSAAPAVAGRAPVPRRPHRAPAPGPHPAPGSAPAARGVPRWVWSLPPVVVLALVFLYPLALVVRQSLTPENGGGAFDAYSAVFASTAFREALGTTVWLAVGATVGCLVLGFALALVIAFVPFPGAKAVSRFIDVFLSFPSFLVTLALLFIYGTVGMANGIWTDVLGVADGPFHFLATPWGSSSRRSPTSPRSSCAPCSPPSPNWTPPSWKWPPRSAPGPPGSSGA